MNILFILKHIFGKICGFVAYSWLIGKYGYYLGQQHIYHRAQRKETLLDKLLVYYIKNPLNESVNFLNTNYLFYEKNVNSDRLFSKVVEQYSDDSLWGYGDTVFQEDVPFCEQQRTQILPLLNSSLANYNENINVLEIGCGNGDVVAYLAQQHPNIQFVGIDFSVKNSEVKHSLNNLNFTKGYALDILENKAIQLDIIFASSTICLFNPKELDNYINLFRERSIIHIFISEPIWGLSKNLSNHKSEHLEGAIWKHDYDFYFKKHGYEIKTKEFTPYMNPKSRRSDIRLHIAHYTLSNV